MDSISIKIYNSISQLPKSWNEVAISNAFLQTPYLKTLEESSPKNMQCYFIGIFENEILIGVLIAQYIDLNQLESFGDRDKCFKTAIRNFVFKNFASHVLFLGNNMISGHNCFAFCKEISLEKISNIIKECSNHLVSLLNEKNIKIHLISFKDFYKNTAIELKKNDFNSIYEFNSQPNMIFELNSTWKNSIDYVASFSKKYRDQYKRARKKINEITHQELSLEDIKIHENRIFELYYYVAKNAPFNTFFLTKDHFYSFKKNCENKFRVFGYFLDNKLIGFYTILQNGDVLETYFLGYENTIQKEKMLYLNMLYDITEFGIENGFKKIIFGRTALEIKSSIGAKPVIMSGFIKHSNLVLNKYMSTIFPYLEPEAVWKERNPFK